MSKSPFDEENLRSRVQSILDSFIAEQRPTLNAISPDTLPLIDSLTSLISGGKRLRPAFAYWGYRSTGATDSDEVMRAATALEFLQACALIHDDVMDASDTRRGKPATHRQFESLHTTESLRGSAEQFGLGAAILIGDLALSWADELLINSGLSSAQIVRAKHIYDVMRTELMAGQYLDLLEQQRGTADPASIKNVIRYKSAKYTIERPLHLGAALGDASPEHLSMLSTYGLHLGEAFQLRDDVLGVFGDSTLTGKPVGDDIREGKHTMLMSYAMERAEHTQLEILNSALGNPSVSQHEIGQVQEILVDTGALAQVEQDIEAGTTTALDALNSDCDEQAAHILTQLAIAATQRAV